jgi:hypothetical protein
MTSKGNSSRNALTFKLVRLESESGSLNPANSNFAPGDSPVEREHYNCARREDTKRLVQAL